MNPGSTLVGLALFLATIPSSEDRQWKMATTLEGFHLELVEDGVQAVVQADGIMKYRVYPGETSSQLILDILNVRNPLEGQKPKDSRALLDCITSEELPMTAGEPSQEGTLARITFELKQPVRHTVRVAEERIELTMRSLGAEAESNYPTGHPIEPEGIDPAVFFGVGEGRPGQYRIGAEDVLEVRVFELDQLNRTVRVEVDGRVILPLIGSVDVAGLTARQAADAVSAKLRNGFVDDPQTTVLVKECHSQTVSLLGAVARPDAYPLLGRQRNLLQLIAKAGGLSPEAGSVLYVFRQLSDGRSARLSVPLSELLVRGDPRWNIRLEPGDVVSVPLEEAIGVSIVGAVASPGVYRLPAGDGATLLVLVARAGGFEGRASKRDVQIKRRDASGEETVFKVDAGKILSGEEPDVVLKEGDVVVVKQSFF
jgi:polysaccharide export outer membrane protein